MLSDVHINSAMSLIKEAFPEIKSLQSTLKVQTSSFENVSDGGIQIFHCGDMEHWVTVCKMDGNVVLYDSIQMDVLSSELEQQIISVFGTKSKELQIKVPVVQKQTNKCDCGLYAIAWAYHLALGEKPEEMTLESKKLRPHFIDCLKNKKMVPFPNSARRMQQRTRHKVITLHTK